MNDHKQRGFYRVAYPRVQRPVLAFEFDQYEVEDISEFGIKIKVDDNDPTFMAGDHVMSMIVFPQGREFDISGHVVRVQDGCVGMQLDTALPKGFVRNEALEMLYKGEAIK
ncbi:MAG: PilZ domain-containing protein [Gammaproteobacteria bacterium]|nr:PilZ domain-containing protein [Gammaproteobacteria bacterium]